MVIYSLKIASTLIEKGFDLKCTGLNFKDESKKVFIFEDTEELRLELLGMGIHIPKNN